MPPRAASLKRSQDLERERLGNKYTDTRMNESHSLFSVLSRFLCPKTKDHSEHMWLEAEKETDH